jgi:TolA-binding protein
MASTGGNSDGIEARLRELESRINGIEGRQVNKDELKPVSSRPESKVEARQKSTSSKSTETAKSKKKKKSKAQPSLSEESPSQLYSKGVRLFLKQKYSEAKKRFILTESKGYKPAASSYYLGEIAYYSKKYDDAIFYFKKSAGLYDQASYIDILLLHTAISLEKVGDKTQAKLFYETIIENYPNKKSARTAKENLKKL